MAEARLVTLEERRESRIIKFAEKTATNPKYCDRWFPKKNIIGSTRHTTPYLEEKANGNRLYKRPIFAMRRILNGTHLIEETDLSGLFGNP